MHCYQHPDISAVASCSQGCGRALCQACSQSFEPPTCVFCADAVAAAERQAVAEVRSAIIKKLVINALFLLAYIIPLAHNPQDPNTPGGVGFLVIFWIIWGFIGFRWILDGFFALTHITIFADLRTWGFTYMVGSVIVGCMGIVVIPILIISELLQFLRLPKTAGVIEQVVPHAEVSPERDFTVPEQVVSAPFAHISTPCETPISHGLEPIEQPSVSVTPSEVAGFSPVAYVAEDRRSIDRYTIPAVQQPAKPNTVWVYVGIAFLCGGLAFYLFHVLPENAKDSEVDRSVPGQYGGSGDDAKVSELNARLERLEAEHAPDRTPSPNPDVVATNHSIPAPRIRVGDRYTYETIDLSNNKLDNITTREVISFSGGQVIQRNVNRKSGYTRILYYDPSWNLVSSGPSAGQDVTFQPPLKYFDFPLFVGKTWEGKSTKQEHKTGAISTHIIRALVAAQENITVPAGTFETFKLVLNIEMLEGNKRTLGKDISWYAPTARRTVRSETESQDPDTGVVSRKTIQLLSFKLK